MKKLIFITAVVAIMGLVSACGSASQDADNTANKEVVSKSAAELSALIEKEPNNPELYYRRANTYFEEKYLDRALADIEQALAISAENPVYIFTQGRILYAMNRTQDAAKKYEKAISIKPDFIEAQLKLAELYYLVKEHKKSLDLFNVILVTDKQNTEALFYKGMNYKEMGDTASAVQAFQKAYEIDQSHYDAVMQLGNLYAGLKNKIALDYYITASRLRPKSPEPPYAAGVFLQQSKDHKRAIKMYEQALKADSKFFQAYYNAALINVEAGRYNDAITSLNTAIRLEPGLTDAYYMRGLCYEALKNKEEAKINYEYALELNPQHTLAGKALKSMGIK